MQTYWVSGSAPPTLPKVVFGWIVDHRDPPRFDEARATHGDELIDLQTLMSIGPIEAPAAWPLAVSHSALGTTTI